MNWGATFEGQREGEQACRLGWAACCLTLGKLLEFLGSSFAHSFIHSFMGPRTHGESQAVDSN